MRNGEFCAPVAVPADEEPQPHSDRSVAPIMVAVVIV